MEEESKSEVPQLKILDCVLASVDQPEYRFSRVRTATDQFMQQMIEEDLVVLRADLKEKNSCGEYKLTGFIEEAIAVCE